MDVKNLLDFDFEVSFQKCEVIQRGVSPPRIYSGPGMVQQNKNGDIFLRVFASGVSEVDAITEMLSATAPGVLSAFQPGVIIPDTEYYDLVATDYQGKQWEARHLSINIYYGQGSATITSKLNSIKKIEIRKSSLRSIFAFVDTELALPWHVRTQTLYQSVIDTFKFQGAKFSWQVKNHERGAELTFSDDLDDEGDDSFNRFLWALSMVSGQPIKPIATRKICANACVTEFFSIKKKAKLVLPPPVKSSLLKCHAAHCFIDCFISSHINANGSCGDHTKNVYDIWNRSASARKGDVENGSLVLSVSIEGLLKEAFESSHDVKQDILEESEVAKIIARKAGFSAKALERVNSSFGYWKNPNPKAILERLKEQGFITQNHIKAWGDLRNSSAHGKGLKGGVGSLQSHLFLFHTCLSLFYILVFILTKYRGTYVDYSSTGWPEKPFS